MHGQVEDEQEDWLLTEPLLLRHGTERISGAGQRPMLVTPEGKYIAISPSGLHILDFMDGQRTGTEIVRAVCNSSRYKAEEVSPMLNEFLHDLRQAGVLTLPPMNTGAKDKVLSFGKWNPVKRFPLTRSAWRYAEPAAMLLFRLPPRLLVAGIFLLVVTAAGCVCAAVMNGAWFQAPQAWPLLLLGMLISTAIHESLHAVALTYNRIKVKDAGVGLLFYIFPIAYVDRTDAYRHQGRWGRVMISLIGPISDLLLAGLSAVIYLAAGGETGEFFRALMLLQVFSAVANLNPLFPSDGYHAAEAAAGAINMRARSITYCLHTLLRTPLPSYLRRLSRKTKSLYVVYVGVSFAYTLLMVYLLILQIASIAIQLAGAA